MADHVRNPAAQAARTRRRPLASLVVAAAFLLCALPGAAPAQSVDELRSRAGQARDRAAALAAQIDSKSGALAAERDRAAAATSRESELTSTLQHGRERAAELAQGVREAKRKLREARRKLHRSAKLLADRLVAIYKSGGTDTLEILLSSDGYDDLATRAEYLDRIQKADQALVDRARELRAEVSSQLEAVAAAREEQRRHNAELEAAREQIAKVRARAQSRVGSLAADLNAQQAALGQLHSQISRWEQQVQRAEQISAAAARQQVASEIDGWAIPKGIVLCESGGNFKAVNPSSGAGGAYQILPSTWKLYGGKGLPQDASPAEQARIAAMIWADSGGSAWACAG